MKDAPMRSTGDCPPGRSSPAKKLAPLLVFGAVAGVGLGWLTNTVFHPNLARTLTADAAVRPGHHDNIVASDAAPERATKEWLERWWMVVQESVKHSE
jgi:hypothetical protein